jgi:hypothetical protein
VHRHAADEMSDECIMTTLPHDEAAVATLPCSGGCAATSSGGGGVFCLGGCRKSSQLDIGINSQIPGIWNVRRFLESVRVDRLWHFCIPAFLHLVPPNVHEVTTKTFAGATKGKGGTESATPNAGTDMNATARQSTGWPSATRVQSNGAGPCFNVVAAAFWRKRTGTGVQRVLRRPTSPVFHWVMDGIKSRNGSYTVPSRSSLPFAATFPCPFSPCCSA